jgi:hypothetical protein
MNCYITVTSFDFALQVFRYRHDRVIPEDLL